MFGKNKKNKYCCYGFYALHYRPKTSDCIRVFKITSSFESYLGWIGYAPYDSGKVRYIENSNIPYRFFLMAALEPPKTKYDKILGGYKLSFCPFCGVNLYTFYAKERNIEDYVNEIEGETF